MRILASVHNLVSTHANGTTCPLFARRPETGLGDLIEPEACSSCKHCASSCGIYLNLTHFMLT